MRRQSIKRGLFILTMPVVVLLAIDALRAVVWIEEKWRALA